MVAEQPPPLATPGCPTGCPTGRARTSGCDARFCTQDVHMRALGTQYWPHVHPHPCPYAPMRKDQNKTRAHWSGCSQQAHSAPDHFAYQGRALGAHRAHVHTHKHPLLILLGDAACTAASPSAPSALHPQAEIVFVRPAHRPLLAMQSKAGLATQLFGRPACVHGPTCHFLILSRPLGRCHQVHQGSLTLRPVVTHCVI